MSAKRRWLVEEAQDEHGEGLGHYDRDQLLAVMSELEAVLFMVGGMVSFATERVEVDRIGGEPLAVSRRVIVDWSGFAPMQRTPERIVLDHTGGEEPVAPELETAAAALTDDLFAEPTPEEIEELDRPLDEDEQEEVDRSLTTTAPPREDASL